MATTKTIKMYKFSELSEEVQDKLIEKNRIIEVDNDWWYDYIIEEFSERMAKIGFKNIETYFRGFWSQGDGASFTCESGYVDIELLFKYLRKCKLLKGRVPYKNDLVISVERTGHYYYHEYTVSANIDLNYLCNFRGNYDFDALEKTITQVVRDFSKELYRDLEKEYVRLTSDESIKQYLLEGDEEYTIDGEKIPYSIFEINN